MIRTVDVEDLRIVTMGWCSCGGREPGDDACPACMIWHSLVTFPELVAARPAEYAACFQVAAFLRWAVRP